MHRQAAALLAAATATLLACAVPTQAISQETVCARVKIEIKQQLTLERQAFDAEMKINNTTTSDVIENVGVVVKVSDELGAPVPITDNPNDLTAKFYIRVASKQNITDIDGNGSVNPATTAVIDWLLIPAPGAAGSSPLGKKYLVGATLKYRYAGEDQTLDVSPGVITVKPLPLLTLDYFLTQTVEGDDPLTADIEPTVPYTLGVRVKNNGLAAARNLAIDSAQPKIIENNQGLLIGFKLLGSYVNDAPAQNTLLAKFGDIALNTSKTARWIMESTLAGKFTEFTAKFTHADELGGSLTSILQGANAHFLIRDVRVDLPGRDLVRDFLAQDGDVIRIYESEGLDTVVTDRSAVAQLTVATNSSGNASYRLTMPATDGFVYVKLPDPFAGQKALGPVQRSDAKTMLPENVWLSRTRNEQTKQWEYWINFFDVNTPGVYTTEFQAPPAVPRAPVLQFIPDRVVKETKQVSFLVEASSPDGKSVTISAAPLPAGASLTMQPTDPSAPTLARALFDWTPAKGTVGNYLINYTASDGTLSASRAAPIKVETNDPPPGPGTPVILTPISGAQVSTQRPALSVQTSTGTGDPTTKVQFEIYSDEAMTQLVQSALVDKTPLAGGQQSPTDWQPGNDLNDNTMYWWRARAYDGTQVYSLWANGRFFVNLFNDPPEPFNAASPAASTEVDSLLPTFTWANTTDRDGDTLAYGVTVYRDAALTDVAAQVTDLPAGAGGSTSWTATLPLVNHQKYYWRVAARDTLGARTSTLARAFTVNTGNTAPTAPVILSPAVGGQTINATTLLTVTNSTDAENDLLTYLFEIDTAASFDSNDKRGSGPVIQSLGGSTNWSVSGLVENKRYWWRVKAQDGRAESPWVVGEFLMNAHNEAPSLPTVKNPGNGAWVATVQPTLEANPSTDPEGDAVQYEFQVFSAVSGPSAAVARGTSSGPSWVVPVPLQDKTTHTWQARTLDPQGQASAWSSLTVMYVSTGSYQDPSILFRAPATPVRPTTEGTAKVFYIAWDGIDQNIESNVALYWSTTNTGFAGNLIVDGLRFTAGVQSSTYRWDVTSLAPGAYYVYGMIYDPKGFGRAYAPGAVVVPNPSPTGVVTVTGNNLSTSETGTQKTFTVKLGRAPTANVDVPISSTSVFEGKPSPAKLTFTPTNWSTNQTVTVVGQNDCSLDGSKSYQILVGKAVSLDPNYIGLSGTTVNATNADSGDQAGTTNSPDIHVCGYTLVSQTQLPSNQWEYTFSMNFTNTGQPLSRVTATLTGMPSGTNTVDGQSSTGMMVTGETIRSTDTVTIRTGKKSNPISFMQTNAKWNVVVERVFN